MTNRIAQLCSEFDEEAMTYGILLTRRLWAKRLAELEGENKKYETILFKLGAMEKAPCFKCGYNGRGYFQPSTHPCAEQHHKLHMSHPKAADGGEVKWRSGQ